MRRILIGQYAAAALAAQAKADAAEQAERKNTGAIEEIRKREAPAPEACEPARRHRRDHPTSPKQRGGR